MTAQTPVPTERPMHPLRAWRKQQRVYDLDKRCHRTLYLTDIHEKHGIAPGVWSAWERYSDEPGFKRPSDDNMRLLFDITDGAITPNSFYPLNEWSEAEPEPADSGG